MVFCSLSFASCTAFFAWAIASCACAMAFLAKSSAFCAPAAMAEVIEVIAAVPVCLTVSMIFDSSAPSPSISGFAIATACAAHISMAPLPLRMAACASIMPALPTLTAISAAASRPLLIWLTAPESWSPTVWTASSAAAFTASNASCACCIACLAIPTTWSAAWCAASSAFFAMSEAAPAASCAASPTFAIASPM